MDRRIVYPGQIPLEVDLLQTNRFAMLGLGYFAQDMLGSGPAAAGLPCTPTSPASLNVKVGAGRFYSLQNVDGTAYSSLAADTTHQILKQGILADPINLACAAPVTAGQSINYLIQAAYQDSDTGSTVLPYYNAANPSVAFSGPGGSGTPQVTARQGLIQITAKAGVPATTGSQTTPAPDSGFTGLYVVTVAQGQTTILTGNITVAAGAPFITGTLGALTQSAADLRYLQLSGGSLTGTLTGTNGSFSGTFTVGGTSVHDAAILTTGSLADARVASSNVTQWQTSLLIAWGQITGTKNADQLSGAVSASAATASTVALRDASGNLFAVYFSQSSSNSENPTVSQIAVTNGTDGFWRKVSLSSFQSQLSLGSIGGSLAASQIGSGTIANARLPNVFAGPGVTIASDPGGTPSGGTFGQVVAYY